MPRKVRIAWDISHLEFTIEDHYYFSILKSEINRGGAIVKEVDSLGQIVDYDVLVLNYPEKPFTKREVKTIRSYLESGRKVIVAGYYNNEDRIADRINSLTTHFGLSLKADRVRDRVNNEGGDELLIVTSRMLSYNMSVGKIIFPCSASVKISAESGRPIVLKEAMPNYRSRVIIGADAAIGEGRLILLGTCVFWDNFAIRKYGNLQFSLNLLLT